MNQFKNIILYSGLSKEEYTSISKEIFEFNKGIWQIVAVVTWFISLYLEASSFLVKDLEGYRVLYTLLIAATTVLGVTVFRAGLNNFKLKLIISLYLIAFLTFGIFLGTFNTPDQMTVTFHVLMISFPLIIILSPLHVFLIEFVMLLVFCLVCTNYKTAMVQSIDVFNGVTFFAVAQIMHYITLRTKLNELLLRKKIEILGLTDELTGLFNRNAYENDLEEIGRDELPEDLVYFSADINGLKKVNDTMGHAAGDELIRGAAECMTKAFAEAGKVYRIGGDEMAAILKASETETEELGKRFRSEVSGWHGNIVSGLSVSLGCASVREFPDEKMEMLANISDNRMYEEKEAYYKATSKTT